jgi:hypothetical protein
VLGSLGDRKAIVKETLARERKKEEKREKRKAIE